MPIWILSLVLSFFSTVAWAHPQFIGYGYTSCVTCHHSGHGGGPLNDYGRALWAAEIAGAAWSWGLDDEDLAMRSGFLGRTEMPWWVRPGIKVRQLHQRSPVGSSDEQTRDITMQADLQLALFFDQSQRWAFVGSYGYLSPAGINPDPSESGTGISRLHYLRYRARDDLWVYAGLFDIIYGIRHADHTAVNRRNLGFDQDSQTHGVALHWLKPSWELSLHGFVGNFLDEEVPEEVRQQGLSSLFEYDLSEGWRVGSSLLLSQSELLTQRRVGFHSRRGWGGGMALQLEAGFMSNEIREANEPAPVGYYLYSEAIQRIARGYHIFAGGQASKADIDQVDGVDQLKINAGLLAYPMQRTEFRLEAEHRRQLSSRPRVNPDIWTLLLQYQLSL